MDFSRRLSLFVVTAGVLATAFAEHAQATTISGALTADNAFFAYIGTSNISQGTLVAQGNSWSQTFTFSNFALTPGNTYYLQIEGINYGGPGAIIGQFTLSDSNFEFANLTQTLLTEPSDWSASYNDSNSNPNSQQTWVAPTGTVTSQGANGVGPWGTRSGISGSADWIDGTTNGLSACGNCTVDFSAVIMPESGSASAPEPQTAVLFMAAGVAVLVFRRLQVSD